jgi:hypothetical protein
MIKNYNRFLNENISNKLEIDVNTHLFDDGFKLFFDIYVGGKQIGECEVGTKFKNDDFDDKVDDYTLSKNMDFNHLNVVNKKDYDTLNFIVSISNFEIDEKYRGNNYGYDSMKLIISYLKDKFPKNKGIYLTVFEDNIPAVKI